MANNRDDVSFKNMTEHEIADAVISAYLDVKNSYYQYGEIIITISGGHVKHINVLKPWENRNKE